MKKILREYINSYVKKILEDRSYSLKTLSPRVSMAVNTDGGYSGINSLNIPSSAIADIKILKSNRPIFRVFFENERYIDIIENPHNIEVNIEGILFDLNDIRDYNASQTELERVMTMGKIPSDEPETSSSEEAIPAEEPSPDTSSPEEETPNEEPIPEEPPV
jgi:hypothetical protein